jgi:hypothetical protein
MGGQADHRRCRRNAVDGNELTGSLRVELRSGEVEAGLGQEAVNETGAVLHPSEPVLDQLSRS